MKIFLKNLTVVVIGATILYGVYIFWPNFRGIQPVINPPPDDIVNILEPGRNNTDFPLKLPDGFSIEIYAKNLSGARVIAFDPENNMWVSRTSAGIVSKLVRNSDGTMTAQDIFRNLKQPHGIAFDYQDPTTIYIAETHRIVRTKLNSDAPLKKIADLPSGNGHFTRTLGFGPDNRLYVSIGSSCNVCHELDERRAAIYSMNRDGADFKQFAKGLRNTVFFTWSYVDGRMWGTDMGRDLLGDNVPPEEINMIKEGGNYGWPICYGNNIHDTNFDKNTYIRNPCMEPFETPQQVEMQAHSAPLGLGFVPEEGWPEDMWYDLIVAFHGSWNRTVPTGYKLVRIKLDARGNFQGQEDFISGWLQGNSALGRPVDVLIQSGGTMYASDGKAGVIYKINYRGLR